VFNLTSAQVDVSAGTVRLEPGTTKNRKPRTIVLTRDLLELVKKQIASIEALKANDTICPFVFHESDGTQIKNVRKSWEAAREAAGYPNALLHDFRRSAARNLGRAGLSRSTAMQITGHLTESIFNRYDIKDETVMREAAAKLQEWCDEQSGRPAAKRPARVRPFKAARN
jgi:integrase